MAKFRKKPVVIEAIRTREAVQSFREDWSRLPEWLIAAFESGKIVISAKCVYVTTLEGTMTAKADDWLICGVAGEIYPCRSDVFAATYESADSESA